MRIYYILGGYDIRIKVYSNINLINSGIRIRDSVMSLFIYKKE